MLQSWRQAKFKSVVDETNLTLAPLTIFTGANSSGKSTILQGILLTAQTLQSSVHTRPVVLNGNIARLGSYGDLVSGGDLDKDITVGFVLAVPPPEQSDRVRRLAAWQQRSVYLYSDAQIESIECAYTFSARGASADLGLLQLQPVLESADLKLAYREVGDTQKTASISIARAIVDVDERLSDLKVSPEAAGRADAESLRYTVKQEGERDGRTQWRASRQARDAVGVSTLHFLPRALTVRFDQVDAEVSAQLEILCEVNRGLLGRGGVGRYADVPINESVVEFVIGVIVDVLGVDFGGVRADRVERALEDFRSSRELRNVARVYELLGRASATSVATAFEASREEVQRRLRSGRGPRFVLEHEPLPTLLAAGVDMIQSFFGRGVRYLGPLRDEPKPVYPLAGATDPADVGFRGEHTAAVLDLHQRTTIEYVPSTAFSGDQYELPQPIRATLLEAVLDWLTYMGVGSALTTSDLGKLGHELKIRTIGSGLDHDLTQVGVGVSQVLPILVLALLAESGSTLVFEQPELHLHPRVQTRLADFFVSMILLHKQCLVETHSEYLVSRLRFRAVADPGETVAKKVAIYFVEKTGVRSSYRRVEIDNHGSLSEWPAGFFDETERGTTELLREGLNKRKRLAARRKRD